MKTTYQIRQKRTCKFIKLLTDKNTNAVLKDIVNSVSKTYNGSS